MSSEDRSRSLEGTLKKVISSVVLPKRFDMLTLFQSRASCPGGGSTCTYLSTPKPLFHPRDRR